MLGVLLDIGKEVTQRLRQILPRAVEGGKDKPPARGPRGGERVRRAKRFLREYWQVILVSVATTILSRLTLGLW